MQIGLRIKELRVKNNISQGALAEKVKTLNQSQICKIEKGKRGIRVNEVTDIANAIGVPVTKLII